MFGLTKAGRELSRGQRALFEGEVDRAVEHLALAVKASPKWFVSRLWLGAAASDAGDFGRARQELEHALELRGGSTVAHLWLARAAIDHERYDDALEILEMLHSREARNLHVASYHRLARWTATDDPSVLAEHGWKIGHGGGSLWGRWLLEIEARFPGGAGTEFAEPPARDDGFLAKLSSRRASRLRLRAERRLEAGNPEAAVGDLDRADAQALGDDEAMELRCRVHRASAEVRAEALRDAPHDVDVRLDLAEDLLEIGDFGEALRVLEPAEEHIESIDPNRLSWKAIQLLLRGRARLARDEVEEAVADFAATRELLPVDVEPVYYHGVALLRVGRRCEGRRALVEACNMDGGLAETRLDELRAALGEPRT